jgi:hypothetical protein
MFEMRNRFGGLLPFALLATTTFCVVNDGIWRDPSMLVSEAPHPRLPVDASSPACA